jgi:TonB family protein
MASILVVERDPRYLEPIRGALSAGGWAVRLVSSTDQAIQSAASEAPDLVVVSAEIPGADNIASSFSRSAGGPGVVGLMPERLVDAQAVALEADEVLFKPFVIDALVAAVERVVALRRQAPPPAILASPDDLQKLTSQDIFGDVLAEVEHEAPATRPTPASASPSGQPRAQRPAAPAAGHPGSKDDVNKKLERTLSGLMSTELKPRPAAPPPQAAAPRRPEPSDSEIDALLSRTLSNLDLGKTKTGVRPPSAPTPPAPPAQATPPAAARPGPPIAAPPAAPPSPGSAAATVQMPVPDFARTPPPSAPIAPLAAPPAAPPQTPPAARRTEGSGPTMVGDLDISDIEKLARPGRQPGPAPQTTTPPASPPAQPEPTRIQPTGASVAPPAARDLGAGGAATQPIPVWTAGEAASGPGSSFGQYTLLERVAVGGMAELWKARSRGVEGFQKTVAIKKILPQLTDNSEFVGMFIDEAKLAAQLSHPNIVHIYDLGKIGRDYYIAMEYVDGKDLRSLLNAARDRGLRLTTGLAALIAARLASALDYAHRKRDFDAKEMGLVHRDVSPQNVLLTYEGDVKLCDFGIAKAVSTVGHTQVGALKGKLQYMSPEQAWGRAVDARSDLFSLGSVYFEMLTGERLFAGDSEISILEAVRQGKVRTPRQVDPSIPTELDEIAARALMVEPERRFQSAGEMLQRLEGYLVHLSPPVGPTDLAAFMERALAPIAAGATPIAPTAPTLTPAVAPAPTPPVAPTPPLAPIPPLAAVPPRPEPAIARAPEPPRVEPRSEPARFTPPIAAPAAAAHAPAARPETVVTSVTALRDVDRRLGDRGGKGRGLLWGGIAAVVVLGALAVGYFKFLRPAAGPQAPAPAPSATPAPVPTLLPGQMGPPAPIGIAPSQPPAQGAPGVNIEGIVNQKLAQQEQALRQQQEESLKQLQAQLAASKAGAKAPAPEPPAIEVAPAAPAQRPVPQESAPPAAEPSPPPVQERPEPKPEAARPREPESAPAPAAPTTHLGDLVAGGPGVTPPQLVSAPNPEYPAMARNLRVQGTVVVSVLVDEDGRVQDARVVEPIRQNVGLNEAAQRAARNARYRPATKDGVRVKMWTRLRVPFKL